MVESFKTSSSSHITTTDSNKEWWVSALFTVNATTLSTKACESQITVPLKMQVVIRQNLLK